MAGRSSTPPRPAHPPPTKVKRSERGGGCAAPLAMSYNGARASVAESRAFCRSRRDRSFDLADPEGVGPQPCRRRVASHRRCEFPRFVVVQGQFPMCFMAFLFLKTITLFELRDRGCVFFITPGFSGKKCYKDTLTSSRNENKSI